MATSKAGYGSFAIDKFDGGLNTAVAPSMLNTKFSPDLYNVDFTDTGGLTRRKGYAALAEFPIVAASYTGVATLTNQSSAAMTYVRHQFTGANVGSRLDAFEFSLAATVTWNVPEIGGAEPEISAYLQRKVGANWVGENPWPVAAFYAPIAKGVHRCTMNRTQNLNATTTYRLVLQFGGGITAGSAVVALDYGALTTGTVTASYSTTGTVIAGKGVFSIYGSASKPVNGLYRYYQTDGDRYWMTCFGGKLYANGSGDAPTERVEAEDVVVAASSAGVSASAFISIDDGVATYAPLSAGRGWLLSASADVAKFTTPQCTNITVGLMGRVANTAGIMSASYRVDDGAWLSATFKGAGKFANYVPKAFPVTGLSDAAHNVYVRLNSQSIPRGASYAIFTDYLDYGSPSSWSTEAIALSATSEQFGFATLNDKCYFSSPYDTLRSYDGNTVATVTATGAPAGAFLIEHKRRLWSAGSATDPAKLSYTNVDDPEDWVGGGDMYLAGKDSGGRCTGLIPWRNQIVYFSDSRIYSIDPSGADTSWTASLVGWNAMSTSIGCVAPKSLVQTDNALIFLSADGVRAYGYIPNLYSSDGSGLLDLSENIRPTLDTITEAMKPKAAGAFYDGRYWLSVALDGASVNNAVLVYDIAKAAWTKYTGMSVSCFFVTRGDEYGLYAGDAQNGKVYRMDYGENDDGAAITMYWKSPQVAPGGFESVKHFRHLHIAAESEVPQTLTVGINTDDVALADQEVSVTANTAAQPLRVEASSRGRSVQYELTSSGAAQPLTVSRLTTTFHQKKVR